MSLDDVKGAVTSGLEALGDVAGAVGLASLAREVRDERLPKLKRGDFLLVVIGEFNHGKTTFVNALLGNDVLPSGVTPTTAAIHEISWGAKAAATVFETDGGQTAVAISDLEKYTCEGSGEVVPIGRIEVTLPVDMLKGGVTIVDTPGVNDLNAQRAEITYGYLPRADAVLFILDATQILKRSEERFLKQRVLRPSREKVIFVANKIDLLEGEEVEEALGFARRHLSDWIPNPYLFPVSSAREVAKSGESGFKEFRAFLARHLADERGKILLDNAIGEGLRTAAFLQETLAIKRVALQMPATELKEKTELLRRRAKESEAQLQSLMARIDDGATRAKGVVEDDLKEFVEAFVAALGREVENVNGSELKQYLAPFIEAKWKEWSEAEGEKVAKALDALADEVIHGVAEESRRHAADLYKELGLVGQRMPLEVDTFAYDATVFAVGAVGTSVMLFMNVVVGGVLTLAAPVLAVILRERVTEKLRAQAKIEGAKAIREIGAKVGPEFEAAIDKFAVRLKEFIATAGSELHRGLLEVFERLGTDRARAEASVEASEADVAAHEVRLNKVVESFWSAKEQVWA